MVKFSKSCFSLGYVRIYIAFLYNILHLIWGYTIIMVLDAIDNCVELHFYQTCNVIIPGAAMQLPVQVVPQEIESVNGFNVTMGCARPVGRIGGVTICGNFGSGGGVISYLLDGNSPDIDTSTSDWASQLVTVRKNDATVDIPFDHVILTFVFDPAVLLTSIELDLLLCPEWSIGTPFIVVYGDNSSALVYSTSSEFLRSYTPNEMSCDSLSTVAISLQEYFFLQGELFYHNWHIVVSFAVQPDIEWVHVGEVRFLGTDVDSTPIPTSADMPVTPWCK